MAIEKKINMEEELAPKVPIPTDTDVSISVYNLQGREVVSLANGSYNAGYHQVIWNGNQNASGLYIVKMTAGDFLSTQKLMLVK